MKTRIFFGAGLLLTLGTAVASGLMYGSGEARGYSSNSPPVYGAEPAMTAGRSPETIAMWKATAASTHYLAPKVPI